MADTICLCWASYELIKIHMSFSDPYEQYPPTAILIYMSIKHCLPKVFCITLQLVNKIVHTDMGFIHFSGENTILWYFLLFAVKFLLCVNRWIYEFTWEQSTQYQLN